MAVAKTEQNVRKRWPMPAWGRLVWGNKPWLVAAMSLTAAATVLLFGDVALAQAAAEASKDEKTLGLTKPVVTMIALASLSLAPFVLVMSTSFLKFSVVGSILRSAMGTQQIPPNQVLMGLALILTVYVMSPTGVKIYHEIEELVSEAAAGGVFTDDSVDIMRRAMEKGKEPYFDFLVKHSKARDRKLFQNMAMVLHRNDPEPYVAHEREFTGLIAAFVTSELTEAFQIGFIIYVPFIMIDMIVSNVLLAMGMHMLSPTIVSLPLKLLLFVLVDGWYLIMRGLVMGYV